MEEWELEECPFTPREEGATVRPPFAMTSRGPNGSGERDRFRAIRRQKANEPDVIPKVSSLLKKINYIFFKVKGEQRNSLWRIHLNSFAHISYFTFLVRGGGGFNFPRRSSSPRPPKRSERLLRSTCFTISTCQSYYIIHFILWRHET